MNKSERVRAALSYVFVLFLLPLADRQSEFCQFHAKQGLVSFVAWIPFVGGLAVLSMLVVNVVAIVKTLRGEKWELPFIGSYAKQVNW
jgi:uncharacterized membrane protein